MPAPPEPPEPPELITIGRVSVDLYAEQLHAPVREVRTFRKSIGGTSTNVAVAAARLGRRAATVTKVGDDPFGDYIRRALPETFGVDARWVGTDPDLPTPLAFAVLDPPEEPQIVFYRRPRAPDMNLRPEDVDREATGRVPILWIPASRLSDEPSRSTVRAVLENRGRRPETVLDLDWRPSFWESEEAAGREMRAALRYATIAVGNREECRIAVETSDPDQAADRLLETGLRAAFIKLGAEGVLAAGADGERARIPPYPVRTVCGLGAGDAFGGALCHGLLSGWRLPECARFGNAAGALVASRLMCADDMPTLGEIENFLASRTGGRPDEPRPEPGEPPTSPAKEQP